MEAHSLLLNAPFITGVYRDSAGEFTLPEQLLRFSELYRPNLDLTWEIEVDEYMNIKLEFINDWDILPGELSPRHKLRKHSEAIGLILLVIQS